jgi:hypothetical protein
MTGSIPPDEEFHTWSEIAGYLHISVREAQYRAKSEGLPVRRGAGKKPRVWAFRAELDTWKSRVVASKAAGSGNPVGEGVQVAAPFPAITDALSASTVELARRAFLGLAGTAVAAAGVAAFLRLGKREPVRATVAGNSLCAWDETGGLVWKYPFRAALHQYKNYDGYGLLKNPERQVQMADFRGDGQKHIVVATAFQQPGGVPDREELYCFTSDGKLEWRYLPQCSFTFGDTKFNGPWTLTDAVIAPDADGTNVVWLSIAHVNWRPSVLVTLSPVGSAKVRFVSAGNIFVLHHVVDPSGRYILAGGVNNEYSSAAMAVLRIDAPPSCSPQTPGTRFECVDGPKGFPDRYFLFPPSELNGAFDQPYNKLTTIASSEALMVETVEVGNFEVMAMYRFSEDIEPVDVAFSESFAAWHRRAQTEGHLNHDLPNCPLLTHPTAVRRWDRRSGWKQIDVPPNRSVRPGSSPG